MNDLLISLNTLLKYRLDYISIKLIGLLSGFFLATAMSTISAQTGDWGILAASVIVTFNEIMSQLVYSIKKPKLEIFYKINYIRIGIIYGLFVDAFKLGS